MPALPLHILVVDDDGDTAATMALLLRLFGHEVRVAPNGPAALRLAREAAPDVVLLDIAMPGMDGFELAVHLRQQPTPRRLVLVAVTGYGTAADRQRSHEAGIDLHLVKPVDSEVLRQLLMKFQNLLTR
jgi:CheY-like chemotaxis protein